MTFYQKKIERINSGIFSNKDQIKTVVDIKNFIDQNYHTTIHLDLLSESSFVSKYHLIRLYKKYYGLTPRQYIIDKRIAEAKKRLKEGMTVGETCYAVGFKSVGSFSTLFKSRTNRTPAQYQKEQLSRNDFDEITRS